MRSTRDRIAASVSIVAMSVLALAAARGGSLADARVDALQARMDSLERRLAAYEGIAGRANGVTKFNAPFQIVDGAGKPIFEVKSDPRSFDLYDAAGKVAVLGSTVTGANFIKVLNATESRVAVLGAETNDVVLSLRDGPDSKRDRLKLAVASDRTPAMLLYNGSGIDVLRVSTGVAGAGAIQTSNPNGDLRVELGTAESDVGVVRTGPGGQCSAPMGPIAPTCLLGHKK